MRRTGALFIMGLLPAAMAAPAATAAVSAPRAVSPPGFTVQQSALGSAGGRTAVVMAGTTRSGSGRRASLQVRVGRGTKLGAAQRLVDGVNTSFPAIAVGANGTVAVAWIEPRRTGGMRLRASIARPGGRFRSPRTLATAAAVSLGGVVVTPTGRSVVAWRTGNAPSLTVTPVQASIAAPGAAFGAPVTLGTSQYYPPAITALPTGLIVVAWTQPPAAPLPPPAPPQTTTVARVDAVTLGAAETSFSPVREVATLTTWYGGPQASSGLGGAVISWIGADRGVVHVSPTGEFGTVAGLPLDGFDRQDDNLGVGVEQDGTDVVLWRVAKFADTTSEEASSAVIQGSVRTPGGTFSSPVAVSREDRLVGAPQAVSLPGRTFAAWSETATNTRSRVRYMVRVAGGPWASAGSSVVARLNPRSVRTAASRSYAAISWIDRSPGGRLFLAAYRP